MKKFCKSFPLNNQFSNRDCRDKKSSLSEKLHNLWRCPIFLSIFTQKKKANDFEDDQNRWLLKSVLMNAKCLRSCFWQRIEDRNFVNQR